MTRRSGYLRDLREQQMNSFPEMPVITLSDDPEVFSTYLHTIYFGRKPLKERVAAMIEENTPHQQQPSDSEGGDEGIKSDTNEAAPDTAETQATTTENHGILKEELVEKFLIDLHLLAVKLRDTAAADLAINELVKLYKQERSVRKEMVAFVYNSAPADSALRLLYRDLHIHRVPDSSSWLEGSMEDTDYPFDFVRDLLRRVWGLKATRAGRDALVPYQRELDGSDYHCRHHPIDTTSTESSASVTQ
jgi:hypothetical protein